VKDWRADWFYAENVLPALAVHTNAGPSVNNRWEKEALTLSEIERIKPFLKEIKALKIQGLSGVGIVASFIRRRVQPLSGEGALRFRRNLANLGRLKT
jgi:hypothetical protein